jgi:hypothetical protein
MNVDIRTIFVATTLGSFLVCLVMLIASRSYAGRIRGVRQWASAFGVSSAGWGLLALRGHVPELLSVVGGNGLITLALMLAYEALRKFNDLPPRLVVVSAILALELGLLTFFTLVVPDLGSRAVIISATMVVLSSMCAWVVLRGPTCTKIFSHWLTGVGFLLVASLSLLRVTQLLAVGRALPNLFTVHPMQDVIYIGWPVETLLITFGFLLMCADRTTADLLDALSKVKTLSGLLPICASCKDVRDDRGYWQQIEVYIRDHSSAEFSHGICPECCKRLYPEYELEAAQDAAG